MEKMNVTASFEGDRQVQLWSMATEPRWSTISKEAKISSCESACAWYLSYGRMALETLGGEPRGLSEPPEAIQRKTVQRPRRRAVLMSRVGITRRGRAEWSRMVPIGIANGSGSVRRDSSPRTISTISPDRSRGGKRGMSGGGPYDI